MIFSVKSGPIVKQVSPCVVVGVFEGRHLTPSASALDKACKGYILDILKRGDIKGKVGQTLVLHKVPRLASDRVLLVGCGPEKALGTMTYRKIADAATGALHQLGVREALFCLAELDVDGHDLHWKARQLTEVAQDNLYRFDRLKSGKSKNDNNSVQLVRLALLAPPRANVAALRKAIHEGEAIAKGMALAKDLGNLPGNICTPGYLASRARELARGKRHIKVTVLEEGDMRRHKMGALLSVARGSRQAPKLIVIEYRGGSRQERPFVLVGKGITFDSGGISIKPSAAMDEMKYDMCGAASVLGTLTAVRELGLPINVIGVIPSCENLPDGNASKPGDIVTSMSGQTIEILNTDAEGRLILCDALTYCERFKPASVIDIATLTGACVIALGNHVSGMLGNHEPLLRALSEAGERSADRVWELPLLEEYQEQLKSNFADMANVGGREAGTITAASFLARFTKDYHWAHLDIAGTAWRSGAKKGATGRPVPLLTEYLIARADR